MNRFYPKSKKNRGATLLIVLIAMALVGILATMVLTMAMSNLQMKNVDKGAKKNFYNAEAALNELRTGLEGDITQVVESTYAEIMLQYASLPVGARGEKFKESLGAKLSKKYDAQGIVTDDNWKNLSTKYDLDVLEEYLDDTKADTTITAKDGRNTLECLFVADDPEKQYICFRNISLGYVENGTKLYTQITTDIKVTFPNANFEAIGVRPAYTEYALIANHQLLVDNGESGQVRGNVYAGDFGILARMGGTLQLNSDQIVVKESIATNEGGNIVIDDINPTDGLPQSNIWVKNIITTAASRFSGIASNLNLTGNLYVSDDTTINAPNSTIRLAGSYYGHGYGDEPEISSAMIVNRRNSLLDLTNLHNVFIAGRAYIEPVVTTLEGLDITSESVLTGEAISSKGNQLAYLLPGECIGVRTDGRNLGHNPLSLAEYQALKDEMEVDRSILEVNKDYVLEFSGKKLSYYVNPEKPFIRIVDQSNTSTLVYYYPNFASEIKANEYFREYISKSDNFDTMLRRLEDNHSYIRLPSNIINNELSGRKTYAGNIVAYADTGSSGWYMYENSVDAILPKQFKKEADDLNTMFEAYNKKLVPSVAKYSSGELDYDNLFDSLIVHTSGDPNYPGITELISGKVLGPNNSYLFEDSSYGDYGKFMLVTNPKTTNADVFDETNAFKVDSSISPDVHILIATGDVEVSADFNGIIISKGIVKIRNGAKITSDSKKVFDLICYSPVRTVFRDYNSIPLFLTNEEDKKIDVGSLITLENWNKN